MTPVFAQIRHGHIVVVMEDEKHKQHTFAFDASLQPVADGEEYGDVLKKIKAIDSAGQKKDRPQPLSHAPKK